MGVDIGANIESEEPDLAEEELYFKRCELLKESLSDKFMNLDEAFLDNFVDKVYSGKKELIVFDVGANVGGVL